MCGNTATKNVLFNINQPETDPNGHYVPFLDFCIGKKIT